MKSILVSGKKDVFYKKLARKFLITNIVGWIIYFTGGFADTFLSGQLFGEEALAAVGIVAPLTSILYFFSALIGTGLMIVHSKFIGEGKKKEADKVFGEAMIGSVALGIIMAFLLFVLKKPILSMFNMNETIYGYASSYYDPLIVYAFFLPILECVYYSLASDGAFLNILLGNLFCVIFNIVVSIILSKTNLGIAGLSVATTIGTFINIFAFAVHYLNKKNTYKLAWYFNIREFFRCIKIGISKSTTTLFVAVVDIIVNIFICNYIGDIYVAPYAIVNFSTTIINALEISGQTIGIVMAIAIGEKNNIDIKTIIKICKKQIVFFSLGLMAVYMSLYAVWPIVYGISSETLVHAARLASLVIGPSFIFYGFNYIYENYYIGLEKPLIPFLSNFLNIFILPLIFSIVLGFFFGFTGICIAFSICAPLTYIILRLVIAKKYKTEFPMPEVNENQFVYEYLVDEESLVKVRNQVMDLLKENNISSSLMNKVGIAIEEVLVQTINDNKNKKIDGRLFIDIDKDKINIIIKDNGKINNLVEGDVKIKSLSNFVLSGILSSSSLTSNYSSVSTNANAIVFDIK